MRLGCALGFSANVIAGNNSADPCYLDHAYRISYY